MPNEIADQIEEEIVTPEPEVELEEQEEQPEEETVAVLKKKLATLEAQKEHWRNKANTPKEVPAQETSTTLSNSDLIAVMKANVHEDDMERVEKFAKMEGVSVKEALKNPELNAILNLRKEQRSTANATNVSNVRRGSTKVSDDVILSNAQAGKLPEDDEGIQRLVSAKLKRK